MGILVLVGVLAIVATTVALIVRGIAAGSGAASADAQFRAERRALGALEGLEVRRLTADDRRPWEDLWADYCEFYRTKLPPETTDLTWSRLIDPAGPFQGWGAFDAGGRLVGFAHLLLHPHTWSPRNLAYLEDLYVAPAFRGRDVGHRLISALWQEAEAHDWGRLYWHTETTNVSARRLYDRFRTADGFVRYTLAR